MRLFQNQVLNEVLGKNLIENQKPHQKPHWESRTSSKTSSKIKILGKTSLRFSLRISMRISMRSCPRSRFLIEILDEVLDDFWWGSWWGSWFSVRFLSKTSFEILILEQSHWDSQWEKTISVGVWTMWMTMIVTSTHVLHSRELGAHKRMTAASNGTIQFCSMRLDVKYSHSYNLLTVSCWLGKH